MDTKSEFVIYALLASLAIIAMAAASNQDTNEEDNGLLSEAQSVNLTCQKWASVHPNLMVNAHHAFVILEGQHTGICFGQGDDIFVFDSEANYYAQLKRLCFNNDDLLACEKYFEVECKDQGEILCKKFIEIQILDCEDYVLESQTKEEWLTAKTYNLIDREVSYDPSLNCPQQGQGGGGPVLN